MVLRTQTNFNEGWTFSAGFDAAQAGVLQSGQTVTLPHNAVDLPLTYLDETSYQRVFQYQKVLEAGAEDMAREICLVCDGAMADAEVYLNGVRLGGHRDGYTPFEIRLTPHLTLGENVIAIKIDGSENPEIPPFGGQIDFLCYAGIYRDVWIRKTDPVYFQNVRVTTEDVLTSAPSATIFARLANPQDMELTGTVSVELVTEDGRPIASAEGVVTGDELRITLEDLPNIRLWSLETPTLYHARVVLTRPDGLNDGVGIVFGFREAVFRVDGFHLNGERVEIRGLNRHQSFPYVGYAMGKRAQERDAKILKNELHLNTVRTSHYPQSPYFLDACDRLGLLVIEEIPGWQHIGGAAWKAESVENVRRMIERDWNHPSIIMWGVRINESADDHEFYSQTNALARDLDPTRQTGGIRCIEDSELIEDVYTMNDFFHAADEDFRGNRPPAPLRGTRDVTGLGRDVPYLVTEFNGHMFPTKRTDSEERQAEHVRRYLEVLDKAYGDRQIAGTIGWCMFDYNTHKDFGSGDRICHHGVLDIFREPKFAAYVYKSQVAPDVEPVLKPVTYWARGERSIGGAMPLVILTNCDYVEFRFGTHAVKRVYPDRETYPHLPYPPVVLDRRTISPTDIGAWGMEWEKAVFTGYVDHKPMVSTTMVADPVPTTMSLQADDTTFPMGEATRLIVRAQDQAGQLLPYIDDVVSLEIEGPARLIGPDVLPFRGGSVGAWLHATGTGDVIVTAFAPRFGVVRLKLAVTQN